MEMGKEVPPGRAKQIQVWCFPVLGSNMVPAGRLSIDARRNFCEAVLKENVRAEKRRGNDLTCEDDEKSGLQCMLFCRCFGGCAPRIVSRAAAAAVDECPAVG